SADSSIDVHKDVPAGEALRVRGTSQMPREGHRANKRTGTTSAISQEAPRVSPVKPPIFRRQIISQPVTTTRTAIAAAAPGHPPTPAPQARRKSRAHTACTDDAFRWNAVASPPSG